MDGMVQSNQEVWRWRSRGKEAIREQWRLGEEKWAVLSVATVTLWWSWSWAGEEPEAL